MIGPGLVDLGDGMGDSIAEGLAYAEILDQLWGVTEEGDISYNSIDIL